jgi:hypothetical protein
MKRNWLAMIVDALIFLAIGCSILFFAGLLLERLFFGA